MNRDSFELADSMSRNITIHQCKNCLKIFKEPSFRLPSWGEPPEGKNVSPCCHNDFISVELT